jgi:hypothetical protein
LEQFACHYGTDAGVLTLKKPGATNIRKAYLSLIISVKD